MENTTAYAPSHAKVSRTVVHWGHLGDLWGSDCFKQSLFGLGTPLEGLVYTVSWVPCCVVSLNREKAGCTGTRQIRRSVISSQCISRFCPSFMLVWNAEPKKLKHKNC